MAEANGSNGRIKEIAIAIGVAIGALGGGGSLIGNRIIHDDMVTRETVTQLIEDRCYPKEQGIRSEGLVSANSASVVRIEEKLKQIESQNTLILEKVIDLQSRMDRRDPRR